MASRPTALALAALAAVSASFACALPQRHVIEDVPFVRQEPRWCGPAALESVLRYHGVEVTQRQIAEDIVLPDGGVLNLDLKLYARRKGLRATSGRGTLDRLKRWVARDTPVICQLRMGGIKGRRNHFVVVYGYDEQEFRFIAHTGQREAQEIPILDFTRLWRDADNWMLVTRPRECEARASQGSK